MSDGPKADLVTRLHAMTDRHTRHDYDIGHFWNAVDEAADEIERLSAELRSLRTLADVCDRESARDHGGSGFVLRYVAQTLRTLAVRGTQPE